MATISEYFETEAREVLNQLDRGLQQLPLPDASELHRAARALRGASQMAREDRVFRAASAFEAVARALASNALTWSEEVAQRAAETITDLRALVDREADEDALDERADAAIERWRSAGIELPDAAPGSVPEVGSASREFREFAAREVAGIADALDQGVQQLAAAPMDREPLKMILRRQRALLGAARLDEVPVVAEILRALEDLTRVIAKLDVGVKQEWLDIYRVAREGLKGTIDALQRDEDPVATHAVSRLRHMREELLERYGAGEPVSAAHQSEGLTQARAVDRARQADAGAAGTASQDAAPAAAQANESADLLLEDVVDAGEPAVLVLGDDQIVAEGTAGAGAAGGSGTAPHAGVVSIDELCYDRDAALARALELRDALTRVAAADPQAREAVDEVFDLIRLASR